MHSNSDATPAYRGYRLQALYTLARILNQQGSPLTFQPEGTEDLAIFDREHRLLETIQVKQRGTNLALSSFKPEKPNSFFYRVSSELDKDPAVKVSIVAFGMVGPEFQKALQEAGTARANVAEKIAAYGHLSKLKASALLEKATLTFADEVQLKTTVYGVIRQSLPGVDPASAFELLMYWLYICAENQTRITRSDVIDRINKVGKFVVARAADQMEWCTSIIPLEDNLSDDSEIRDQLASEFYQGISARYEHILADLDVIRPEKLTAISSAFRDKRVVIVHSASGQGKTTLAYRYLRDFFPAQWRFRIASLGSREQTLRVALALSKQADAIGIPLAVYVDVSPRDTEWSELVRELATHPSIQVLVTIREEDWRRANMSGAEMPFNLVDLDFDRSEAQRIYESLTSKVTPATVLDFEEAWTKFGEAGPLMEFIYLVSQGTSIYERLKQQVTYLEDEVREGRLHASELELLRLVSVASAFEARLLTVPLVQHLQLSAPRSTLRLFEKEYLLRLSAKDSLIGGLHPIRSGILADLLSDPDFAPWSRSASTCLAFIEETDLEGFLLYAFSRRRADLDPLLKTLASYQPKTWTAIAGCIRSQIWLGVAEYITTNHELIKDAAEQVGQGWANFLDFDIASSSSDEIARSWWRDVDEVPEEGKKLLEKLQARQTDKKEVFARVTRWLSSRTDRPEIPASEQDWEAAAESIFWLQHLDIPWPLTKWLPEDALDATIQSLSLGALANLILAVANSEQFEVWLSENRPRCLNRFRREMLSVRLDDDGHKTTTHFVFDLDQLNEAPSTASTQQIHIPENRLHGEAEQRIELLRKFLPEREEFASQGYGHLLWDGFLDFDESQKTGVARKHIPIRWLTSVNALLGGLGNQQFRTNSWEEYSGLLLNLRETVLSSVKQLEAGLETHFRRRKASQIWNFEVNSEAWGQCKRMLNDPPLLPLTAVDEWGFVSESSSRKSAQEERRVLVSRNGLALQKYQSYLKAFNEYTRTLRNFFVQSVDGMILQPLLGKGGNRDKVLEAAKQDGMKIESARLATLNLAEAIKNLPGFQDAIRPLLAPFYESNRLNKLDKKEREVFRRIWAMWYFFAAHPNEVIQNASTEYIGRPLGLIRKIRLKLRDALRGISSEQIKIAIVSESITWDAQPALWLTVDAHQPWDAYGALDGIVAAIRQAVTAGEKDLRRYTLDFYWPYLIIVPLTRGRYITPVAWRISLPVVLQTDEATGLKWWNLVQHQIPADALAQLNLRGWDLPGLAPGMKLLQATGLLFSIAAHIRDFRRLTEIDNEGVELLQGYVNRLTSHLSEALQLALDAEIEMASAINSLTPSELQTRPALIEVAQILTELHNLIMPSANFDKVETLTLEKLIEWADRLEQAPQRALICSLDWTADVLDQAAIRS
jgi:hypothetical protein